MKLIERYFEYKEKYPQYILIVKVGMFYEIYGTDTKIMNELFDYKIVNYMNTKRVGFPSASLNKVLKKLLELKINYVVISKDSIMEKKRFQFNQYEEQKDDNLNERIKNINNNLKELKSKYNISEILAKIEDLL